MKFPKIILIAVVLIGVIAGVYFYLNNAPKKAGAPPPVESVLPKEFLAAYKAEKEGKKTASAKPAADTGNALAPGVNATFTGDGRSHFHVETKNTTNKPARITLKAGQVFEGGKSTVVLMEGCDRDIAPGETLKFDLKSAATNSAAVTGNDTYKKSAATVPKLDVLLQHLKARADVSSAAVQVAVLALAENPPLDTFAKFARLHGMPPACDDFKVDTLEIIAAMGLLSDIGVNDRTIGADPQLKIEAMIDPSSHDAALRYYGIAPEMEWTYWKHELLEGDPSTRHYALYGIARYYPDVALKMMPKWARETRLLSIYRLSAVRAMALTHRPEAIPILHQLGQEFGSDSDLSKSADRAEKYLSTQFNQPS
jgi:hypothetical protein